MNDLSNGIRPVLATARRHDDTDPQETAEWLDALDGVVAHAGAERAQYRRCLFYTSPRPRD